MVSPAIRVTGASLYLLISVVGIILNALLIIVLLHSKNTKLKRSFFLLIWQIIACCLMSQFVQLTLVIPSTFAGYDIFRNELIPRAIALFDALSYNGLLYFSLALTISRLVAIVLPKINEKMFGGKRVFGSILFVWVAVWTFVIVTQATGCWNTFDFYGFFLKHECKQNLSSFAIQLGSVWGANTANYFPVLMLVIYVALFCYVRFAFKPTSGTPTYVKSRRRQEYLLLMQGFIISSYLELQNISFMYFPLVDDPHFIVAFLQNVIVQVGSALNAVIIFSFNKEIRKAFLNLLLCRTTKQLHKVTPASVTNRQGRFHVTPQSANIR